MDQLSEHFPLSTSIASQKWIEKYSFQLRHSVWKLMKKSHSSLRAKRATFTCWQKLVENAKSENFWVIFKQCIRDFSGIKCCVCLCCIDFYYYHTSELRGTFQWIIFHTSMEVSFGRVLGVLFAFVVSISFSYTRRNHSAGKLHTERDYMAIVIPLLKK